MKYKNNQKKKKKASKLKLTPHPSLTSSSYCHQYAIPSPAGKPHFDLDDDSSNVQR